MLKIIDYSYALPLPDTHAFTHACMHAIISLQAVGKSTDVIGEARVRRLAWLFIQQIHDAIKSWQKIDKTVCISELSPWVSLSIIG